MFIKILLTVYSLLSIFVNSTFIDQRQSGDLNVQVDLKRLHIIALMKGGKEEYVDYDYAYDYSEMTIKPQNRTTVNPLNVTNATVKPDAVNNVTIATTAIVETTAVPTQESDNMEVVTEQIVYNDNSTVQNTVPYLNVTEPPVIPQSTTLVETTSIATFNSTKTPTVCRKGYVLNSKGDCELKIQGTGNALLKLLKLSQKLKLRRENKSVNSDSDTISEK